LAAGLTVNTALTDVLSANAAMLNSGLTVSGLLCARGKLSPGGIALWDCARGEAWVPTTWQAYCGTVGRLSSGLRKLGLGAGERVGIMAANCREWDFFQFAVLAAGGVAVGLDPLAPKPYTSAIAQRCKFAGLVVGNSSLLEKVDPSARATVRFVISIDSDEAAGAISMDSILRQQTTPDAEWNRAEPDAPATVVFSSGTTGEPKGIEYTHRQMCLAAATILAAFSDVREDSRLTCWLPLSNLFQRMINLSAIGCGAQTFYVSDPREVMSFVKTTAPHVFVGVPRFYEKLYAGMQLVLAKQPAWQQRLVDWALRIGERRAQELRANGRARVGSRLAFSLADWIVLSRLRAALGPNLRFMISGSAPMPLWLLERFHAMGLLVLEAYGVSENIIPIAVNRPDAFRFGTVGRAVPGSEVRLADDGELLVRGPGVFSGYLGELGAVASIDSEGYLASGDFASIDSDGFITLIGRKSEISKTSTGRRIAPSRIEGFLQQVPNVEYAVVFAARRAQPVALMVLTEAAWQAQAADSFANLRRQTEQVTGGLPPYERPAGLVVTAQLLTIAGGDLTVNLKIRRHAVEARHAVVLGELQSRLEVAEGRPFAAWAADRQFFLCSV